MVGSGGQRDKLITALLALHGRDSVKVHQVKGRGSRIFIL